MKINRLKTLFVVSLSVALSGCTQDIGLELSKRANLPQFCLLADGSVVPSGDGDCENGPGGPPLSSRTETFDASSITSKKIDMILVVDNSGSMGDEQLKVKDGLVAAGQAYFSQPNIDVCVWVISSSYYNGTSGQGGFVGCSSTTPPSDLATSIGSSITSLGVSGLPNEQVGKSLVTYLTSKSNFGSVLTSASLSLRSGFRSDATKAIVNVSDENNFFAYSSSGQTNHSLTVEGFNALTGVNSNSSSMWNSVGEWIMDKNDLPASQGQLRRNTANASDLNNLVPDTRLGIKQYLGQLMNLSKVTTLNFLKLDANGAPSPLVSDPVSMGAVNLHQLKNEIGNGSINASIDLDEAGYTAQFDDLFTNSISISNRFTLSQPAATELGLRVAIVRNGSEIVLSYGSQYTLVLAGSAVELKPSVVSGILPGDQVKVTYFY